MQKWPGSPYTHLHIFSLMLTSTLAYTLIHITGKREECWDPFSQLLSSMNMGIHAGLTRSACFPKDWCYWFKLSSIKFNFITQFILQHISNIRLQVFVMRCHVVVTKNQCPCILCLANQVFDCKAWQTFPVCG